MKKIVIDDDYLARIEQIRAFIASIPLACSARGVTFLDFDAYRRGERRQSGAAQEVSSAVSP